MDFYSKLLDIVLQKYPSHKVVMLPQTFNYGTYLGDDYLFFCDFKKYVKKTNIEVIPDCYSSDIQQSIISKASCMIGARYHSIVFAINQGIPFVALSYEHKISGLLNILGKTECMVDITKVFEDKNNERTCINDFSNKIFRVSSSLEAKTKAKKIAFDSFCKFVDIF
jgi:colanic acid/amylovoran biosynthesis protein